MGKTFFTKKSKIFRSFLLSYAVFLAIIICVGVFSIAVSSNVIRNQVDQIYSASLGQLQVSIESYISYASKTASELMFNTRVQSLHFTGYSTRPNDLLTMVDLLKDLRNVTLANPIVSEIAIYFPSGNFVLDGVTCYRKNALDWWSNSNFNADFSDLSNNIMGSFSSGNTLVLSNPITSQDFSKTELLYIKTLGNYPISSPQPVLIITLNGNLISSHMKKYESTSGATVYLTVGNNHVLTSDFTMVDFDSNVQPYSRIDKSNATLDLPAGSFVVQQPFSIIDASCVCIVPSSVYLNKVHHTVKVIIGVIIVFTIIGITLSFIFSKKSYSPIKKLSELLESSNLKVSEYESEYFFIESTLRDILNEKKYLRKNLDVNKSELRDNALSKILRGNVVSDSIPKTLDFYSIEFEGELVLSTAYIIEDCGPHFPSCDIDSYDGLLYYSAINVIEELTMNKFDCFTCRSDKIIHCISCSNIESDEFYKASVAIAEAVIEFFGNKLNVKLVATVSHPHPGASSISIANLECMESFEYRDATGKTDSVIYPSENDKSDVEFGYSLNTEKLFINCVKCGSFERAREHLDILIEQCRGIQSLSHLKIKMAGLVNSVISVLGECNNIDFQLLLDSVDRLVKAKSIDDIKYEILNILDEIIQYSEKISETSSPTSVENIKDYLNKNFADSMLNISSLAEEFGLNRSYLSQKFKKETGISPHEYLSRLRIERAKQMIVNGYSNFSKIATSCGYYDSHALNVAFKKFEGVPPSKYQITLSPIPETESAQV